MPIPARPHPATDRHLIVVGALHLTAASFVAALVGFLWYCAAGLAPVFSGTFVPGLVAAFGRPVALLALAFALFEGVSAVALLRGRAWPRRTLLVAGALQLAVVPLGTALGLYTAWAIWRQRGAAPGAAAQSPATK